MRGWTIVIAGALIGLTACSEAPPAPNAQGGEAGHAESADPPESPQAVAPDPPPSDTAAGPVRRLGLPVFATDGAQPADRCGLTTDYVDVKLFKGKNAVPRTFAKDRAPPVVLIRWLPEQEIIDALGAYDPGNVDGKGWCTGTLVSKNQILTAGHCFEPQFKSTTQSGYVTPSKPPNREPQDYATPAQIASVMEVVFGFETPTAGETVYAIRKLEEHENNKRDYAVIEIADTPKSGAVIGGVPFKLPQHATVARDNPKAKDTLVVIQHPGGSPKKIDVGSLKLTTDKITTERPKDRLVYDDLDTSGGSSGAAVLDAAGLVRGVHVEGWCQDGLGNEAVGIKWILEVSPAMRKIAGIN